MRPTAFGAKAIGFGGLLVGAFFVSPYSNLFFLQIAFLGALLGASAFGCARNVARLTGRVHEPRPFAAGSVDAVLDGELAGTRRTTHAVRIEFVLANGTRAVLCDAVEVPPATIVRVRGGLPPLPRGIHGIRAARAISTSPFGLFRAARTLVAPPALVVFPAPIDLPGLRTAAGLAAVAASLGDSPIVPGDDVVAGLREWRDGDSPRSVHWRATARRGQPIVKERDGSSGECVVVVLDRRGDATRVERALGETATLALASRDRAEPIELISQDTHLRFGEGGAPIDDLLRWLAGASVLPADAPSPPTGPPRALHLPRRSRATTPTRARTETPA